MKNLSGHPITIVDSTTKKVICYIPMSRDKPLRASCEKEKVLNDQGLPISKFSYSVKNDLVQKVKRLLRQMALS